ncbi:hypothetical protein F5B20DRAFT_583275 [Whalleya microplaca]|nr:hypothetical protein F5B20DRAFT_583275 [Whalleya microplaca]
MPCPHCDKEKPICCCPPHANVSVSDTNTSASTRGSLSGGAGTKRSISQISAPSEDDSDILPAAKRLHKLTELRASIWTRLSSAQAALESCLRTFAESPTPEDEVPNSPPASVVEDDKPDADGDVQEDEPWDDDLESVEADLDDLESFNPEDTFVLLNELVDELGLDEFLEEEQMVGLEGNTLDGIESLYKVFAGEEEAEQDEDEE